MSSTTTTIVLQGLNLLLDIRNKSHQEVADIADVKQKYHVEAGTDKDEDVKRSLQEAIHMLKNVCRDFLISSSSETTTEVDDSLEGITEESEIELELHLSGRRDGILQAEDLANVIHSYVVNKALELFYGNTPIKELAQLHMTRAAESEAKLRGMLYRKRKPDYTQY